MRIKEGLKIRDIAGEKVLIMQGRVGADMTKLISFNPTAEWLWNNFIDRDFKEEDVVDLLIEHYDIDIDTAVNDAGIWIEQLQSCKAID
jgi:hypothetical protein